MIYFNGTALESVAPVMVEDIRVSPVERSVTARPRPIAAGSEYVRMVYGTRTVTITFGLLTQDIDTRQNQLAAIARWAAAETEKPLVLPHRPDAFLNCVCTALPDPSMRQWWESRLAITFTAYDDPFFTASSEKACSCGEQLITAGDTLPLMRIAATLINESNNLTYSNGAESMSFAGVPAGELVIDLNRQTATVDGVSVMDKYVFGSTFVRPRIGAQTIQGAGTVMWRERWLA